MELWHKSRTYLNLLAKMIFMIAPNNNYHLLKKTFHNNFSQMKVNTNR